MLFPRKGGRHRKTHRRSRRTERIGAGRLNSSRKSSLFGKLSGEFSEGRKLKAKRKQIAWA
jgi:hypothetical protein